jgi:hypothetical protein
MKIYDSVSLQFVSRGPREGHTDLGWIIISIKW